MKLLSKLAILIFSLCLIPSALKAADTSPLAAEIATEFEAAELDTTGAESHAHEEHHGLPPAAVEIFNIGPLKVTNSMFLTIIVSVLLIFFAQMATRNIQDVPSGLQNFFEWLIESLFEFLESIMGYELVKKTFWLFATLFIFILATNWFGLVPGVGTLGWETSDGHFEPWLRGSHADLNMTTAMAVFFFVMWCVWSLQANGISGVYNHIFGNKGGGAGFMKLFMIAIFFFVGILEVVSIVFRPVSLSFRLYGNVFAGENILESMLMIVPWLGWLIPLPFYFLELLVGLVQALVFMLLTAVFTLLMCEHHDEDHGKAH
ncbi:MAG: F0F1 ATP synthase subunit A [Verrucomicrobia bacterium]|nr:F0F1 ATP synthase subunit A [Verrucomicrobiota bacterium]